MRLRRNGWLVVLLHVVVLGHVGCDGDIDPVMRGDDVDIDAGTEAGTDGDDNGDAEGDADSDTDSDTDADSFNDADTDGSFDSGFEVDYSEPFSGPDDFRWYNIDHYEIIHDFVGLLFERPSYNGADNSGKYRNISRDTEIFHSAPASLRLYSSAEGGTSEVYTRRIEATDEVWVSWWERLSSDYDINEGHKWFLFKLEQESGDSYLNWQSWDGGSDRQLCSRVYNSGPIACSPQTFAQTKCIDLPTERWYRYKVHLKLNTPGVSDGYFQVWMDLQDGNGWQTLWDLENVDTIRCHADDELIGLRFGGTRQRSSGVSSRGTKWIDDIEVGLRGG
jgi:hypothetical protein